MEIRSILVNFEYGTYSPTLTKCAVALAERFNAHLIGLASAQPSSAVTVMEVPAATAQFYEQELKDIEDNIRTMEIQFRQCGLPADRLEWRSFIDAPTPGLISGAASADLILAGSRLGGGNTSGRAANLGDVILSAGRPLIAVGSGIAQISGEKILVGWKDSREARRAIADALPFLKQAQDVLITAIDEGDFARQKSDLDAVVGWCRRHEVKVRGEITPLKVSAASTLEDLAKEMGADLIVTGGYAHSRLREWLLGGVTRDLLASPLISRFMSN